MLRVSMLLSCILMTNAQDSYQQGLFSNEVDVTTSAGSDNTSSSGNNNGSYSSGRQRAMDNTVTCYICVNVSNNLVCNRYAIDRPCRSGETFCHTLHVMDSKGTSVLVNKKCTTSKECQRNKVGCIKVDTQMMCVSCCDHDYCNVNVPTNHSNAIYDDQVSRMRTAMKEKSLFDGPEVVLSTSIRNIGNQMHAATAILMAVAILVAAVDVHL